MLTAKQIEEARKTIYDELTYHGVDDSSTIDALERLDALCAQAQLTAEALAEGDFVGHAAEDFDAAE